MMGTTYSVIINKLEHELDTARNNAAGYADMGDTEGSIYEDGVVAGISRALDIVKKGKSVTDLTGADWYNTLDFAVVYKIDVRAKSV